ncbi:hypothetical protein GJAV_G00103690 [Gymnothorax javanicus]|nr:hypothetical protein GJAV_G00103690 [Gymnothorax javanicus]
MPLLLNPLVQVIFDPGERRKGKSFQSYSFRQIFVGKMSVSVTTVNGLVVVTQVFQPGEEMKIPMNTIGASTASAAAVAPAKPKPVEPVEPSIPVSPMTKRFLQGQPKPLGIIQIFIGLISIALGILVILQKPMLWGTPLWAGGMFVISGIISAVAYKGTRPCLVRSTLAFNVLCCLVATAGIVLIALHLIYERFEESGCRERDHSSYYRDDKYYWMCQEMYWKFRNVMDGIRGLLIVLYAFQLAVSISGAVYSGQASCASSFVKPTAVVIERPTVSTLDASYYGSDEALLGSDEAPGNPPPYDN